MGLDSYLDDDDEEEEVDVEEDNGDDNEEVEENNLTGIDAYLDKESDDEDDTVWGVSASAWSNMSKYARVKYVRDNYISDYCPDYSLDDRWSYESVTEVTCVCGNIFTFIDAGMCIECGRAYKDAGRTVVKVFDPEDQEINESETSSNS